MKSLPFAFISVVAVASCAPPPPARIVTTPLPATKYVEPEVGLNNSGLDTALVGKLNKTVKTAIEEAVAPGVAIAVGRNGHLYVSDAELKALVEIDEGGRAVHQWPLPLHPVQPFQVPYVSVDPRGHAYVSDFNGLAVFHARPDKAEVELIGASESLEGSSGVTTRDGELLVIKGSGNKVLRLSLP